jgi:hypothetical protein
MRQPFREEIRRRCQERRPRGATRGPTGIPAGPRRSDPRTGHGHSLRGRRPHPPRRLGERRDRPRHRQFRRADDCAVVANDSAPALSAGPLAAHHGRCRGQQRGPGPSVEVGTAAVGQSHGPDDHDLLRPTRHPQMDHDRASPLFLHQPQRAGAAGESGGDRQPDRGTRTTTGLRVRCKRDRGTYPQGRAVSDEQLIALRLTSVVSMNALRRRAPRPWTAAT